MAVENSSDNAGGIAELEQPTAPPSESLPAARPLSISVVMPVRNEARFIERTLQALLNQNYDPRCFEVLVVDGESTDATREIVARIAREHPCVRLLRNPRRLSSAARNVGIAHARGDVVVIVDGHCELKQRDYLARLASAFERSGADALGRPQPLDVTGATALQRAIATARSSPLGHHPDSFIYSREERFVPAKSVAVAYRRSVFAQVGAFDERFDACEDVELNHRIDRAGLRCFFTPDIAVHYVPRGTLRGLFRQLVRYGRGRVRLLRKHRDTFSLLPFVPALFVAGLVVGPLAALAWKPLAIVYVAVLLLYAAILLAGSVIAAARAKDFRQMLWLPLVFATVHIGSGTGLLWELLWPASRERSKQGLESHSLAVAESRASTARTGNT